ncbi:MAG: adenylosuccinate lyase [Acidobacteria bacterium]|nr:adenylosuccinate lyase [Acidobacteriota bacterium]
MLELGNAAVAEEEADEEHEGQRAGQQRHRAQGCLRGAAGVACRDGRSRHRQQYNSDVKRGTASNPLTERYASKEMSYLFSSDFKFRTWRRLWIALAEAEQELGLNITDAQLAELRANSEDINYEDAERREREVRHDVMSHIHAFGLQAPSAKGIIHLGATSAFVTDNTDIVQMAEGLKILRRRMVNLMAKLREFAWRWRATPTLAFTHFQPAQLTTVGKRATLWLHDLVLDYHDLVFRESQLALLGVKGATGTQASFLNLFGGDEAKVDRLEQLVAEKLGFARSYPVSGQTYSRKVDAHVIASLSGFGQSASKFGYDMRLLQHLREIEEPFEEEQVGSSAMAYKRNPMRAERIDALSRHLIVNALNPALTAATQWFERTLDDSANRRVAIPEAFLAADAIALIYDNVVAGLVVHEEVIAANVRRELPFLMTENLMMEGVQRGGDRQVLHERVRIHSQAAADELKRGAAENDLFDRIAKDELFGIDREAIARLSVAENYTGLAKQQTERFLIGDVDPILTKEKGQIDDEVGEVRV